VRVFDRLAPDDQARMIRFGFWTEAYGTQIERDLLELGLPSSVCDAVRASLVALHYAVIEQVAARQAAIAPSA
jgi:hypothetical protein